MQIIGYAIFILQISQYLNFDYIIELSARGMWKIKNGKLAIHHPTFSKDKELTILDYSSNKLVITNGNTSWSSISAYHKVSGKKVTAIMVGKSTLKRVE